MVRAAGSTDYNMVPRVGSGRCSQLSPDIRTAGTSERRPWCGQEISGDKRDKQNTYHLRLVRSSEFGETVAFVGIENICSRKRNVECNIDLRNVK